jgi:hypothetical protein
VFAALMSVWVEIWTGGMELSSPAEVYVLWKTVYSRKGDSLSGVEMVVEESINVLVAALCKARFTSRTLGNPSGGVRVFSSVIGSTLGRL